MKSFILILIPALFLGTRAKSEPMETYVLEVTTFHYRAGVSSDNFWLEDAKIQANYTSQQPGFISRESGYAADTNEVIVVVRWKTAADAEASMQRFMTDPSVMTYAQMIEASSMKMQRYDMK